MNYKIAIDLSTTNSGIAIEKQTRQVHLYNVDTTACKTFDEYCFVWRQHLNNIFPIIIGSGYDKLTVGIEVANFNNAKLTQKFGTIAGMLIMWFHIWSPYSIELETKTFNSNQWQSMIGCKTTDTREIRKQKAKEYVSNLSKYWLFNCDNWTQDVIDSWCILDCLDKLNTNYEIEEITKQKKKTQEQIKKEKYRKMISIQQKILVLQEELKNLNEEKNSRRIKTVLNKLDILKKELKEIKNGQI